MKSWNKASHISTVELLLTLLALLHFYFIPWKKYFKQKNISCLFESSDHQGHSGKMLVPKKFRIHTREKRAKKIHTQTISKISYTFLKDVWYLSKEKTIFQTKSLLCFSENLILYTSTKKLKVFHFRFLFNIALFF